MANSAQARKRARQANKKRDHNKARASRMRTVIKDVVKAIDANDKDAATANYHTMVSIIDNAAQNGLIHRNKAARYKSRLNSHIHAM